MPLSPGISIRDDKYHIIRLIGEGGMARVWLAEEPNFGNRQVAIKEPHAGLGSTDSEELRQRFLREVKVSAALAKAKTPNIVQALTAEPYEGGLLLVLEYMPGGDLEQRIRQHPDGMPLDEVIAIARDVLTALAAVHKNRLDIVHRDIKPSNILFDEEDRARLGDFGLAQVAGWSAGRSMLEGGTHPGTPLYSAPEQATERGYLTPAADIYAFGCVLFEMLTGKKYKRFKPGTRAGSLRAEVPDWLDDFVAKALKEDQWERWQSGEEIAAAFAVGAAQEARQAREAEEKKRREQEARERAKEEAARKRVEEERKRREREAAEKRKKEEEAARKRAAEERLRREKEEAERQRQALLRRLKVPETVKVPAGEFIMGRTRKQVDEVIKQCVKAGNSKSNCKRWYEDQLPQHTVYVDDFEIAKYPLTVAQFEIFVKETGHRTTAEKKGSGWVWTGKWEERKGADWRHPHGPDSDIKGKEDHPVTQVSWHDAVAYCQWLSEKTGQTWRLPTEAEWEKAARGTDGRIYPWGNGEPDKTLCNYNMNVKDTTPVDQYPAGASPYGALDMAGNVWEWCVDWYDADYYPHSPRRNPTGPETGKYRVLRGGSWDNYAGFVRSAYRNYSSPDDRNDSWGFRPARSPSCWISGFWHSGFWNGGFPKRTLPFGRPQGEDFLKNEKTLHYPAGWVWPIDVSGRARAAVG